MALASSSHTRRSDLAASEGSNTHSSRLCPVAPDLHGEFALCQGDSAEWVAVVEAAVEEHQ